MSNMKLSSTDVTTPTGKKWKKTAGAWADAKIQPYLHSTWDPFIIRSVRDHDCTIDPREIVGTTKVGFVGISWRQALCEKRMGLKLECLEKKPQYYSDPKHYKTTEESWSFYEIQGQYYPIEGTHRSIVAKFRAHEEGHTSQLVWWVDRLTFSHEAYQAYVDLKSLLLLGEKVFIPVKKRLWPISSEDVKEYEIFVTFRLYTWSGRKFYTLPIEEAVTFAKNKNPALRRHLAKFPALYRGLFGLDQ